jgi:CheY-like chemotaxis protein
MSHKGNTSPVTVLLVEDDQIDVMGVQRAFSKCRISNPIAVASDGMEALEILRAKRIKKPFLILLDLNMPRMNGIEFLDAIRSDEELRDSIVFVLTTSKADEDKWAAYRRNIAGYIVKENVGEEFLDAIALLDVYWKIVEMPC